MGLVTAMAGCAGSDSEPAQSAAESWASAVCSSIGQWSTTIEQARTTLGNPADLSANEARETLEQVGASTRALATDLDGLGAPDTESGAEAERLVTALSEELHQQLEVVKDAAEQHPEGASQHLDRMAVVSGAAAAMASATETTIDDLRALDGASELEDAFKGADSCQDLRR
jgi:hypothetical protein